MLELGKEQPTRKDKLLVCKEKKVQTEFDLYEQSVLNEFGYSLSAEVM